ncbi:hypothetical protein TVAG_360050 [Trichomonas vaginalis G3]|uniref:Uncharacterized protein n=1 Tax=Trichomonas vaginalis (strain ATCC PRA-98 / G3) TaxID=412133 RepID=A2DTC4_TRIV3|nr:hypothetical protein TVAGG3_0967910 [Trichomonas vaginalis G3]EAY16396.1 hypothetical protein TVAG_360050 [Trichomonas vaginalis G3]KAI5488376.1 hypothetical protein TVAGG3_0967910 [Trichomonas vaginalis G3]|eukprot:XP_001328619.1 hypothetical protein [Trichomonas vaginalis G3]
MSLVGEKFYDFLFCDDSQLSSLGLDFYTSVVESESATFLNDLFSTVLQKIGLFLGSSFSLQRISGWRFVYSLLLHNIDILNGTENLILDLICEKTSNTFDSDVIDIVCDIIYGLIGFVEIDELHCKGMFEIYKLCQNQSYNSLYVCSSFLKFIATYYSVVEVSNELFEFMSSSFNLIEGTEKQEECKNFLDSYSEMKAK